MRKEDNEKFKELIAVIATTYDEKMPPAVSKVWAKLFKDYSIEQFEKAVYDHLSCPDAGMFPPKPANLIKLMQGSSKEKEMITQGKAEMAWAIVYKEIGRIGSYGTLELEDKVALATVQSIGGWKSLCACTMEQLDFKRKAFISAYSSYERVPVEALPEKLPGREELIEHKQTMPAQKLLEKMREV